MIWLFGGLSALVAFAIVILYAAIANDDDERGG